MSHAGSHCLEVGASFIRSAHPDTHRRRGTLAVLPNKKPRFCGASEGLFAFELLKVLGWILLELRDAGLAANLDRLALVDERSLFAHRV